ncbi:MAG TPA: LytTR family transcriptional regulator DNA-binding domain-containing protein [Flavipsychrobacter sp.]|jgi:two-component system LytT family response regulator|nr:LytTR family transcriptional regulator DNA-binding domain-containing protein [Flavipsychrobacter sp.]
MYKVVIIDDEPLARQLIRTLLATYEQIEIVGEGTDGFEGFKEIQKQQPDLVFLDVQMPRINGFEMLELLDPLPSVIFTTAFDEYAMKAFEANAIDYLLKPITKERFDKALQKWFAFTSSTEDISKQTIITENVYEGYRNRIVVKDNSRILIIQDHEIEYIEASDDYVKIYTKTEKFLKKSTLSFIEQSLNPQQFIRVHRSYLIPVNRIVKLEPYEKDSIVAILQNGSKVPVSKSGLAKLKETLGW